MIPDFKSKLEQYRAEAAIESLLRSSLPSYLCTKYAFLEHPISSFRIVQVNLRFPKLETKNSASYPTQFQTRASFPHPQV